MEIIGGNEIYIPNELRKCFSVNFSVSSEGDGYVRMHIEAYKNGEKVDIYGKSSSLYTAVSNGKVYVSTNSSDDASELAGREIIPDVTVVEENVIYTGDTPKASASFYVTGTLRWTDNIGVTHPAQNLRVKIYDLENGTEILLAETETNSSGSYRVNVPYMPAYEYNLFIKVYLSGCNVTVQSSNGSDYYYQSSTSQNVSMGGTITKSYTFSSSDNLGKAVSVHQAIALASRYMKTVENDYLSNIVVSFPDNSKSVFVYNTVESN